MVLSRRRFITTSGTFAAGSGVFLLQACNKSNVPDVQQLKLDYAGPHLHFEDFRDLSSGLEAVEVIENGFERSVYSSSRLAYLAEPLGNRGVKLLMLLEQGKDVLVLPPLATDYDEYSAIQLQCNMLDQRLALMNPFRYFPSVQELKRLINTGSTGKIGSIEISIDPGYNIPYLPPVEGICGPGLLLITTINEILASYPVSVLVQLSGSPSQDNGQELTSLIFNYQDIILNCHYVPGNGGWKIIVNGEKGILELRDSGEMISGDTTRLIKADRRVMLNSLRYSIEDFIESVRTMKEPESNSVEGMMQIAINLAVERAISSGEKIELIERPYLFESDKEWMQENKS